MGPETDYANALIRFQQMFGPVCPALDTRPEATEYAARLNETPTPDAPEPMEGETE